MPYELINLTLPIVIEETDNILQEYPTYPYQVSFSIHEMRQKLIAHILSEIPNYYTVEGTALPPKKSKALYRTLEQRLYLEDVIRESILHILQENTDWLSHNTSQKDYSFN